jgi:hypothetical protein
MRYEPHNLPTHLLLLLRGSVEDLAACCANALAGNRSSSTACCSTTSLAWCRDWGWWGRGKRSAEMDYLTLGLGGLTSIVTAVDVAAWDAR